MSQLQKLKDYLGGINIDAAEKNFTFDFCKKNEYITSLMEAVANDVNGHVSMGYGNVNGKIMMIFLDEDKLKILKSFVQKLLDKYHIDFWSIYVTFIDKTLKDYPKKYNVIMNEINAIRPEVIYFIDKDDTEIIKLKQEFSKYGLKLPKHYLIETEKLINDDKQSQREIWKVFKFAINYKDFPKQ